MPRKITKRVEDMKPGEYVLLGSYWGLIESIEDGGVSKFAPDERLAVVKGLRRGWKESGWSDQFDTPFACAGVYYLSSVLRWMPAEAEQTA